MDDVSVAQRQQRGLHDYLEAHLAQEVPNARAGAREKLIKLQKIPFQELSTDVYDESMRRQDTESGTRLSDGADQLSTPPPFLQVRQDFHPKRNQARQKLATLPSGRFKDLASDVLYELGRRFPPSSVEKKDLYSSEPPPRPEVVDSNTQSRPSANQAAPERPERNLLARRQKQDSSEQVATQARLEETSRGSGNQAAKPQAQGVTTNVIIPTKGTVDLGQFQEMEHNSLSARSDLHSLGSSNGWRPSTQESNRGLDSGRSQPASRHSKSDRDFETSTLAAKVESLEAELDRVQSDLRLQTQEHTQAVDRLQRSLQEERTNHRATRENLEEATRKIESLRAAEKRTVEERDAAMRRIAEHESVRNEESKLQYRHKELQKDYHLQKDVTTSLKTQLENIVEEMQQLSSRNQSLLQEQHQINAAFGKLQLENEQLRSQVASSRRPTSDDRTTVFTKDTDFEQALSPSGGIQQSHLNALKLAIDDLLVTGRSEKHANVLKPMRKVLACSKDLGNDVRLWLTEVHHLDEEERETIEDLRDKLDATMDNLMTATRNHAAGMGLSPISLLDAAASHVAMTSIELAKAIGVRPQGNGTSAHDGRDGRSADQTVLPRHLMSDSSFEDSRPKQLMGVSEPTDHQHSDRSKTIQYAGSQNEKALERTQDYSRPIEGPPPPVQVSDYILSSQADRLSADPSHESANLEDWEDLKNHLEVQTEQVVSSIQAVLTCVRSMGANGSQTAGLSSSSEALIAEHITHIITIISSVIAVTRQTFASSASRGQGKSQTIQTCEDFLAGLEHSCDQMSELQTKLGHGGGGDSHGEVPTFTKASKQALASASFSVAKTLKQLLNALGGDEDV